MSAVSLAVAVDRTETDTITVSSQSLEVTESFEIVLESTHPAHVHCQLTGDLEAVASLEGTDGNYYVDSTEPTHVLVTIEPLEHPVEGTLECSVGYGAAAVTVSVTVAPPSPTATDSDDRVTASATPATATPVTRVGGLELETALVLAVGVIAIATGAVATAVIGSTVVFVGFLFVTAGVLVAIGLLLGVL